MKFWQILLIFLCLPGPVFGLAEQTPSGRIDWINETITCHGTAESLDLQDAAQKEEIAKRVARAEACRNLYETLTDLRFNAEKKLSQVVEISKINNLIRQNLAKTDQETMVAKITFDEIRSLITVPTAETEPVYTSLIIEIFNPRYLPSLYPRILDEQGQEVFSGMAYYVNSKATAQNHKFAGRLPLWIKARAEQTRISVDSVDAQRLKQLPGSTKIIIILSGG